VHNNALEQVIRNEIQSRREKALKASNAVEGLGIPIKLRDEPLQYIVPIKRRELAVTKPAVPTEKYVREPAFDEEHYKHILSVLRSMSLVIERNPNVFASLDEECRR